MIRAFFLSLGDLADRRIVGVMIRSLLITLAIFALLGIGIGWALAGSDPCGWIGPDSCELGGTASGIGAVALTLLGLWLLFPAVAIGVISAFIDRVMAVIEARHYPAAAASAKPLSAAGGVMLGLRSAGRVLVYNLLALPLYIVLLVTGVGTLVLFVIVNGIAFGRDLGEMVAARHGDRGELRAWLGLTRGGRILIGAAVTALFLVPILNLLAPILGAAMMTHYHHATRGRQAMARGR